MRLSISAAAAPHLGAEALDAACRARGLDGQEVVAGEVATRVRVVAIRRESLGAARAVAPIAAGLEVPVSVPAAVVPLEALPALAEVFAGARLLLAHGTDPDEARALARAIRDAGAPPSLGLAWDVRPSTEDLGRASAVLAASLDLLGLVRLHGGGPEQRDQDGRGVGPLFVDLALSRYVGPIVLCPSAPEALPRWAAWLASQRSAGCGHRVDARTLVVDVRGVEPRDRLETILGAYRSLAPGDTLRLTVDHDPSCMDFTLRATEPEGSFTFRTLEHGPEVWRAEVTRR